MDQEVVFKVDPDDPRCPMIQEMFGSQSESLHFGLQSYNFDDERRCSNCKMPWSTENRQPSCLPCGHVWCSSCIVQRFRADGALTQCPCGSKCHSRRIIRIDSDMYYSTGVKPAEFLIKQIKLLAAETEKKRLKALLERAKLPKILDDKLNSKRKAASSHRTDMEERLREIELQVLKTEDRAIKLEMELLKRRRRIAEAGAHFLSTLSKSNNSAVSGRGARFLSPEPESYNVAVNEVLNVLDTSIGYK